MSGWCGKESEKELVSGWGQVLRVLCRRISSFAFTWQPGLLYQKKSALSMSQGSSLHDVMLQGNPLLQRPQPVLPSCKAAEMGEVERKVKGQNFLSCARGSASSAWLLFWLGEVGSLNEQSRRGCWFIGAALRQPWLYRQISGMDLGSQSLAVFAIHCSTTVLSASSDHRGVPPQFAASRDSNRLGTLRERHFLCFHKGGE